MDFPVCCIQRLEGYSSVVSLISVFPPVSRLFPHIFPPFCLPPFYVCSSPLFSLLFPLSPLSQLGVELEIGVFIMGPDYSAKHKQRLALGNFLFKQAKFAIWLTRKTMIKEGQVAGPMLVFRGIVLERLNIEYVYFICLAI